MKAQKCEEIRNFYCYCRQSSCATRFAKHTSSADYHMGTFLCAVCLRYSEADVMPLVMNAAAACRHLMTCDVREGLPFIISAPALQAKAIIPISTLFSKF